MSLRDEIIEAGANAMVVSEGLPAPLAYDAACAAILQNAPLMAVLGECEAALMVVIEDAEQYGRLREFAMSVAICTSALAKLRELRG